MMSEAERQFKRFADATQEGLRKLAESPSPFFPDALEVVVSLAERTPEWPNWNGHDVVSAHDLDVKGDWVCRRCGLALYDTDVHDECLFETESCSGEFRLP